MKEKVERVTRGEIYIAELDGIESEQKGYRPVLIIQNNTGNKFSPTTIIAPITSKPKKELPTHMDISSLESLSIVLLEQVRVLSKTRLVKKVGELPKCRFAELDKKLMISLGIGGIA